MRRGIILEFSLAENLSLHDFRHEPNAHLGWLRPSRMIASARGLISEFDVRGGTPSSKASELSGGNQQKLVVAREVSRDPRLLIAAQPTRGLDVGAIAFLHSRLVAERDEGRAILLVSLELDEIMSLSDRILVMYEGRDRRRVRAWGRRRDARDRDDRRRRRRGGRGVSDVPAGGSAQPPQGDRRQGDTPSAAERFSAFQRAGGLVVPLITMLLAFLIAGLVVLVTTGHNPLSTYRAIFDGTGLSWFFHPGSYRIGVPFTDRTVWFPLNTNSLESRDAYALQQTLLLTTTLIFTGLAVAFAFRCGLFNIGGNGQYIAGSLAAVWVGSSFADMAQFPHVVLGIAPPASPGRCSPESQAS